MDTILTVDQTVQLMIKGYAIKAFLWGVLTGGALTATILIVIHRCFRKR